MGSPLFAPPLPGYSERPWSVLRNAVLAGLEQARQPAGAERSRHPVPYADQRVWAMRDASGEIAAAIAVNVALRELQASKYGFAVPADLDAAAAAGRVCEFLTFFVVGDRSLASKHALWTEMFEDLRSAGFTTALATTAPKVLPMYRRMGVAVRGETRIEGEVRYFLRFDLGRTARSVSPRGD